MPDEPLPQTIRRIEAVDGKGGVRLTNGPLPVPGRGEVLVRMAASPVNPSDLHLIYNISGEGRAYPLPAGREGSGTVAATGSGFLARRLAGRRVAWAGSGGAWAEYAVAKATNCIPLPAALNLEQGAALVINPLSALALMDIARKGGHKAIVNAPAAGQLGQMILRLGKSRDIPIIHIVRRSEQVKTLRGLGADHVLNSSDPDFGEALGALAQKLNATLFLDAVGGQMTGQFIRAAPPGSTILLYGNLSRKPVSFQPSLLFTQNMRIEGFFLGSWSAAQSLPTLLAAIKRAVRLAQDSLATTIARKFLLTEIDSALAFAQQHASEGKALLVVDPEAVDLRVN